MNYFVAQPLVRACRKAKAQLSKLVLKIPSRVILTPSYAIAARLFEKGKFRPILIELKRVSFGRRELSPGSAGVLAGRTHRLGETVGQTCLYCGNGQSFASSMPAGRLMPHSFCCKRSQSGRAAARMIVAGPFKARTGGQKGFRRGSDDCLFTLYTGLERPV